MANKYTVNFSCGHTDEIEISGTEQEVERKIKYYETSGTCSACYKSGLGKKTQKEFEAVRMPYTDYKNKYSNLRTKAKSYDKEDKTVIVYFPKIDKVDYDVMYNYYKRKGLTMELFQKQMAEFYNTYGQLSKEKAHVLAAEMTQELEEEKKKKDIHLTEYDLVQLKKARKEINQIYEYHYGDSRMRKELNRLETIIEKLDYLINE